MKSRSFQRLIIAAAVASMLCFAGCGKSSKGVLIVKDGQVKVRSLSLGEDGRIPQLWEPGMVVLFRTAGKTPAGETGKAGEAYEIDDSNKLHKIGEFDLNKTDEELVKDYN